MKVYKNELTISFDCDDTLVMWKDDVFQPGEGKIRIEDPDEKDSARYLVPHQRHIRFLKKCANRGYQVTVWSSGGWAWAESIVRTLGLEDYVTKIESKPLKVVDDLPLGEILHNRVYLEDVPDGSD